ncbi:protein kinase [Agromyces aurantiacus]|uniref:non-specific serine/threonine protein kinase n=1 Tax=Agromyces aurantiacus TaxID=165814 RepID=A0ABV9R7N6_9MICO|nr:serine/threonine-protein kinase [Agromyces aurantiacus]MBM7505093.1 serine/threonine protein kinase [Agromyces aurantiacus]
MRRPPSSPPELPGYTHLGLLGSGGFADVFLYEQRLPRRKVAVKVLLADDIDAGTRAQFVAEANLMARLSAHPFIVTIFHADVSADGRPYFVMEYCSGPSLSERYKRQPLSVEDALRTGIRLSGAVATAHAAGILHRDIKPANVLTNDYGWPALSDFGISSDLEGELPVHTMSFTADPGATGSRTGSDRAAVGMSVPWSPPELFEDDPRPDTRSDVFALAATVHTLLAGRTPFEIPGRSNGPLDLIGRIERGRVTPIGRDDVPASLEAVLATGMAVRREDRYQSAVEFGRALQRIELELGYSVTGIEVPSLPTADPGAVESGPDAAAEPGAPDDDAATRARAVRVVHAEPPPGPAPMSAPLRAAAPDEDATRARSVREVRAQPGAAASSASSMAGDLGDAVEDGTVVRPAVSGAARPSGPSSEAEPADRPARRRRAVTGAIVAAASIVVVGAVAAAIALGGAGSAGGEDPSTPEPSAEDAIIAARVPAPEVGDGERTSGGDVVFPVSHEPTEDGDRYRWRRVDGVGTTAVATGSEIVVQGVADGATVCIEVQVQRGSKTSEPVRGCSG